MFIGYSFEIDEKKICGGNKTFSLNFALFLFHTQTAG